MITKHVYLPISVVAEVELALPFDEVRKIVKQGAWSHLVEALLREWLAKNREERSKERCQLTA